MSNKIGYPAEILNDSIKLEKLEKKIKMLEEILEREFKTAKKTYIYVDQPYYYGWLDAIDTVRRALDI